jgi:hypothetical protein
VKENCRQFEVRGSPDGIQPSDNANLSSSSDDEQKHQPRVKGQQLEANTKLLQHKRHTLLCNLRVGKFGFGFVQQYIQIIIT